MKKVIMTVVAMSAFATPMVVPTLASASVTSQVAQQFSRVIHNRANLSGYNVVATSVKCANDGGGYYSCYGTYTILTHGYHAKFGVYINVTPGGRWNTTSNGRLVATW
jgi:putative effector of murein hydrolase